MITRGEEVEATARQQLGWSISAVDTTLGTRPQDGAGAFAGRSRGRVTAAVEVGPSREGRDVTAGSVCRQRSHSGHTRRVSRVPQQTSG